MAQHHRRLLAAGPALAVVLALAACSAPAAQSGDSPVEGGDLIWGVASEPTCFDPHFADVIIDRSIVRNYVDSLVYQEEDGTFTPWLADSWEVSADGTEYVFEIKDGVTFTDGAALDAAAVQANIDFVRDAANGSIYSNLLGSVATTASEGQTLTVTLTSPDASLLASLSGTPLGIVSPDTLALGDESCTPGSGLAGTGPFVLGDYTRGEQVVLTRNDDYNSAPQSADHDGAAYLDTVTYRFLTEDSVRVSALQSGQVDAISGIPALDVESLDEADDLSLEVGPSTLSTFGFTVNANTKPWDDVNLRAALRDSFDAEEIVDAVYRGQAERAWSWVGANSPEFDETLVDGWGDDVEGANEKLDAAGWTERDSEGFRTKDGERLSIAVTYDADSVRDQRDTLIEAIQDQVAENSGIEIVFTTPTWAEVSATIEDGTWSVYPGSFGKVDYANSVIGSFGSYFYANAVWQPTATVDLATRAIASTDPAEYKGLLDQIQQDLVIDDVIFIPIVESNYKLASSGRVGGVGFDYSSGVPDGNYGVWLGK